MSKYLLDIPDDLHDKIRHQAIETKQEYKEIIVEALKRYFEVC